MSVQAQVQGKCLHVTPFPNPAGNRISDEQTNIRTDRHTRVYYRVVRRGGLLSVVSHKSDFGNQEIRQLELAVKLGTVRDFVGSARKGFMQKVHRRPW